MASNINQEEINASDSSYSEDEEDEVAIFDENGNSIDLNRNVRKVVSTVPLIKRRGKRGKRNAMFF